MKPVRMKPTHEKLILVICGLAMMIFSGYMAYEAISTGVVSFRGHESSLEDSPISFWITVSILMIVFLSGLLAIYHALLRH